MTERRLGTAACGPITRDTLADCEGIVRWGGDDGDVDESLFYVAAAPHDELLRQVADKLRRWDATPGKGAGAGVDVLSPAHHRRADHLAHVQQSA
ncbi:hypothetical protein [Streptomyces zagrosensis]|uniref:Uncharacterized protein n=1 Tax=Streptomyces zagrosensis TaxID=1042984 RepID=A0A7W9QH74_9ACTN|nr:hypothetical protein [Streptomyces zagrosensis]MBB5940220.1 hypothetical protein [Streptomyces zagrosensis]